MNKKYLLIALLAAIGVGNAWYLTYETLGIFAAQAQGGLLGALPCDLTSTLSCSGILSNPRAVIFTIGEFKVAFPMIAAVVYPILLVVALWGWFSQKILPAKILTIMAGGGILFNSYVIYQEFVVGVFCPLCAVCTLLIITIFILALMMWRREKAFPIVG